LSEFWAKCTMYCNYTSMLTCTFWKTSGLCVFIGCFTACSIKKIKQLLQSNSSIIFFSVKCKLFSGVERRICPPCFIFVLFWVWIEISLEGTGQSRGTDLEGSVPLVLILFLLIFGLVELITFRWKTCFMEKVFKLIKFIRLFVE